jgi:hypothetical protein
MTRTVNEILRDARWTHADMMASAAFMWARSRRLVYRKAAEHIAAQIATDPAERAALVQHMIANRPQ